MTTVTRQVQDEITNDIREALAKIAKKYNLGTPTVDLRRDRAGTMVRLMKLDMFVETAARAATKEAAVAEFGGDVDPALAAALKRIGVTKLTNRKGERIISYKPNRYKYPFVTQGPRGGRWKATEADVLAAFS